MIIGVPRVLNADEVQTILSVLEGQKFMDGKATAGASAAPVKKNLELELGSEVQRSLSDTLVAALRRNIGFVDSTFPRRFGPFLINRYDTGMAYGDHVDNPLNGLYTGDPIRSDLSITIFLSDPES